VLIFSLAMAVLIISNFVTFHLIKVDETYIDSHYFLTKLFCLTMLIYIIYICLFVNENCNEGKSAASFCHQVQHWSQICFATFIWWNITKWLITQQPLKYLLGSLKILEFFDVCLTKFENYQILLNKISRRFLVTMKLFIG